MLTFKSDKEIRHTRPAIKENLKEKINQRGGIFFCEKKFRSDLKTPFNSRHNAKILSFKFCQKYIINR